MYSLVEHMASTNHSTFFFPQSTAKVQQCSPLSSASRQLCQHFSAGSCDFYSLCIDSLLSCGPQSFAQAYAQRRCESMRQLNASINSPLVQWAASQDQCLQARLYSLLASGSNQQSCLQFERAAFDQLSTCYSNSKQQLCASLKVMDSKAFLRDIPPLLQAIGGSEYYVGLATRQLEEAIVSCNTSLPVDTVFPKATVHHATYCIAVQPGSAALTTPDQFISVLVSRVGSNGGSWKYIGVDWDWRCVNTRAGLSKPVSPSSYDYFHFVAWYPNGTSVAAPDIPSDLDTWSYSSYATFIYLRFSVHYTNTTCGDGLLQAGELCDLAVYNGASNLTTASFHPAHGNGTGCSLGCTNTPTFECYAGPLQPSICAKVTCGDGVKASTEACDDGNSNNTDGCSSSCAVEAGYQCRVAGLQSLCKRVFQPPSSNTTASPTRYRPGTLHPYVATPMTSSPQPSSEYGIVASSFLHVFFSLMALLLVR